MGPCPVRSPSTGQKHARAASSPAAAAPSPDTSDTCTVESFAFNPESTTATPATTDEEVSASDDCDPFGFGLSTSEHSRHICRQGICFCSSRTKSVRRVGFRFSSAAASAFSFWRCAMMNS